MSNSSVGLPFWLAHWLSVTRASLSEKTCFTIMSATHDSKILLGTLSKEKGRQFPISVVSSFLNTGVSLATFQLL